MGQQSKIEWTDSSWNPVMGCTPVSPGCDNCYARTMIKRYAGCKGWPENSDDITIFPERLETPFRWKKTRRVFVCSMGDLFHHRVFFDFKAALFGVMAANPQHTFLVLTKRPQKMIDFFVYLLLEEKEDPRLKCAYQLLRYEALYGPKGDSGPIHTQWGPSPEGPWPLPNVWLGVTAENQEMADKRIPLLLKCPAAKHFVSVEPMLEAINLNHWLDPMMTSSNSLEKRTIDWVICGGETGPSARPMHPDWVRSIRDQCQKAEIKFFFKHYGEYRECLPPSEWEREDPRKYNIIESHGAHFVRLGKKQAGRVLDGRTLDEIPEVAK